MPTVKDVTYELLRRHGMDTIFGNPGSNELPFLAGMPDDFRYILGLHEGVVAGMADGYAQATGRPAFVNLHAASGTGNAVGALTNAWYAHSPLVITAGQQVRSTVGQEVMLSNVDAAQLPRPLVKFSAEPLDATDVPRTLGQAIHAATLEPRGPVYVSVPYDDWARDAGSESEHIAERIVTRGGELSAGQASEIAGILAAAESPVLVLGPDVDTAGAQHDAVALAERLGSPVWVAPSAPRCPFPTDHPAFRGLLPASIAGIAGLLEGHDIVLVAGAPAFRYHQHDPGRYLPDGTRVLHLTSDGGEAARAPFGDAVVTAVGPALARLAALVPDSGRAFSPRPAMPPAPASEEGRISPEALFDAVSELSPDDAVFVNETTSTVEVFWDRVRMSHPQSYYFPASGGLGFGMPAALGVQLADADRQVVALIGDGSANYGITALWTAAQYNIPVIFVILNNGTYGALRGFAAKLGALDAPGLDVPGIDFASLAAAYGVEAERVDTLAEFRAAFTAAVNAGGPRLIEAPIGVVSPF